jgi:hypothetical protein
MMIHSAAEIEVGALIRARRVWERNNALDPADHRFDIRERQTAMCEACGHRHAIVGACYPTNGRS